MTCKRLYEDVGTNGDRAAFVATSAGMARAIGFPLVEEHHGARFGDRANASAVNLEDATMRKGDHVGRLAMLRADAGAGQGSGNA